MKKILALLIVSMLLSTANAAVIINDASFENIDINPNSFLYGPASPDWTFISTSGVIDPFSAFTSSEAPDMENSSDLSRTRVPSCKKYFFQPQEITELVI